MRRLLIIFILLIQFNQTFAGAEYACMAVDCFCKNEMNIDGKDSASSKNNPQPDIIDFELSDAEYCHKTQQFINIEIRAAQIRNYNLSPCKVFFNTPADIKTPPPKA